MRGSASSCSAPGSPWPPLSGERLQAGGCHTGTQAARGQAQGPQSAPQRPHASASGRTLRQWQCWLSGNFSGEGDGNPAVTSQLTPSITCPSITCTQPTSAAVSHQALHSCLPKVCPCFRVTTPSFLGDSPSVWGWAEMTPQPSYAPLRGCKTSR